MENKVIIIGGGPAGYHSALSCRKAGFSVTLIEKEQIGGTCAHKGCIPTRSYLSAIQAKQQLAALNPSLMQKLNFSKQELYETTQQKIEQLTFGMEYMLRKQKVKYIQDTASITGEKEVSLSDGTKLFCDYLVIATGSEAMIPAQHQIRQLYTDAELLTLSQLPDTLTIVGAGVLGVELAVILNAVGCEITLAERENRILPSWDADISSHIQAYLEQLGINIQTSASAITAENGVFCIGRKPKLPPYAEHVSLHAPWIFMAGDVTGGVMTADAASTQGDGIAEQMISGSGASSPAAPLTQCLFTPLEAASTGSCSKDDDLVGYLDIGYTASGILFGSDLGFIKIHADARTHELKGGHIVSHRASEIIQILQLAIQQKMTIETFLRTTFPHPTEGELLKEVMRSMR